MAKNKVAKVEPVVEVEESDEVDYTTYADKPATDLQERFAEWITDKTEYDPSAAKTKQAAFEDGVRLSVFLRIPFQKSPENQEARAEKAAEPKAAKKAKEAQAEETPVAAKKGKKGKLAVVPDVEPDEPEVTETVAAPAKRGPRKASGSKAAPF